MSLNFRKVRKIEVRQVETSPGGEDFQISGKVRMVGSTRTGSNEQFGTSQGASSSISGRELNRDALTVVRDRNQLPARDSAGTNQTARISGTAQRFGGFGVSGNASGSGSSAGSRNNTLDSRGRAQVTSNVTSGGYQQYGNEMVRTGGRGALKIEVEKTNIPTQPTGERRKIKIETEKVNIPKPVTKGRRVIRIEGEKEDQAESNLRDRSQEKEKVVETKVDHSECQRRIRELEAIIREQEKEINTLVLEHEKEIKQKDAEFNRMVAEYEKKLKEKEDEFNKRYAQLEKEKDDKYNKMVAEYEKRLKEKDDKYNKMVSDYEKKLKDLNDKFNKMVADYEKIIKEKDDKFNKTVSQY